MVTASDDFVRGQQFRGFTVKKLSDFEGDFIVAVAFASCIPEVMNHIYSLNEKHRVLVPCVPVFGDEIFNREFIEKHENELISAYSLFEEDLYAEIDLKNCAEKRISAGGTSIASIEEQINYVKDFLHKA